MEPIDKLHWAHIGHKLSIACVPPDFSETMCPQ